MKKPENLTLVIFGASGDLAKRKIIPSLYNLYKRNYLPEGFSVLGLGRTEYSNDKFREFMKNSLNSYSKMMEDNPEAVNTFLAKLYYLSFNTGESESYGELKHRLEELDAKYNAGNRYLFYLATPPVLYKTISTNLNLHELTSEKSEKDWKRIIFEKPFGYNLESARELNQHVKKFFSEDQIFRIDHYLGKETVQNLLVTRFSNGIFEPLWNRNYVHHVEITSAESIGVESRGGYYENAGALRDMVQNHLMQITGLVAMEPPSSFDTDSIRNETLKVFQSLRRYKINEVSKNVLRGQYSNSIVKGIKVSGYREEQGVDPDSRTETFVALKFFIDNWRWGGVPFYIRSGKRLPTRVTEVVIHFKPTPHYLFSKEDDCTSCNQLVIRIQPDEGILLKFGMKIPGAGFDVQNVNMDFHYSDLRNSYIPEAYERLLLDCMLGDATLYIRGDAVEEAWRFIQPVQKAWEENPEIKIYGYPAGSWGPENTDDLIEENGMTWRYPCKNLSEDGIYCEL